MINALLVFLYSRINRWIFNFKTEISIDNLMVTVIIQREREREREKKTERVRQRETQREIYSVLNTKLAWFEKVRSIKEDEVESMCIASQMIWLRPYEDAVESILVPSVVVILFLHQTVALALKYPLTIIKQFFCNNIWQKLLNIE